MLGIGGRLPVVGLPLRRVGSRLRVGLLRGFRLLDLRLWECRLLAAFLVSDLIVFFLHHFHSSGLSKVPKEIKVAGSFSRGIIGFERDEGGGQHLTQGPVFGPLTNRVMREQSGNT